MIRRRTILLGLPLSLLAFWLVVRMEQRDQTGLPTGLALYTHVVALLLALIGGNAALRRIAPRAAATRAELLCLFSMMSASSAFACWEMLGTLLPAIAYPAKWLGDGAPDRQELAAEALRRLPGPLLPRDPEAARQVFAGLRRGEAVAWAAWRGPYLAWGGLLLVTVAMAHAGSRLLFPRWKDHEKLAFPLVALPLAMTDPGGGLWRNRLFQAGFALTLGLDLLNGAAALYPWLPSVNTKAVWFNAEPTDPAWIAFGHLPVTFHPIVLGLVFFLPVDLLFSCWFFFLLQRAVKFGFGAFNLFEGGLYQFGGNQPGVNEQNAGAILALAAVAVRAAARSGRGEGAPPRGAVATVAVGALVWLAALRWFGVSWPIGALFLAGAGALAVLTARLRAEMGMPTHNLQFLSPDLVIGVGLGPGLLGRDTLAGLTAVHPLLRSQQGSLLPHLMEARHLAGPGGERRFVVAVGLASVLAVVAGPPILLGTLAGFGLENTPGGFHAFMTDGWDQWRKWLSQGGAPDLRAMGYLALGAAATFGLLALRHAWPGSPLHPLGYALSGSWGLMVVVTPMLIAWAVKSLLLRYGGLEAYRRAIPLAHGLILGEFVAGTFWSVVAVLLGQPTYRIWLF